MDTQPIQGTRFTTDTHYVGKVGRAGTKLHAISKLTKTPECGAKKKAQAVTAVRSSYPVDCTGCQKR